MIGHEPIVLSPSNDRPLLYLAYMTLRKYAAIDAEDQPAPFLCSADKRHLFVPAEQVHSAWTASGAEWNRASSRSFYQEEAPMGARAASRRKKRRSDRKGVCPRHVCRRTATCPAGTDDA